MGPAPAPAADLPELEALDAGDLRLALDRGARGHQVTALQDVVGLGQVAEHQARAAADERRPAVRPDYQLGPQDLLTGRTGEPHTTDGPSFVEQVAHDHVHGLGLGLRRSPREVEPAGDPWHPPARMTFPSATVTTAAVLGLIFSALSLAVVALRVRHRVPYGDGGIEPLHRAVRAHGNFAEYVPLALLLLGALEVRSGGGPLLHGLLVALVVARLAHPVALFSPVGTPRYTVLRITGALVTWLVLTAAALALLA